MPNLLIEIGTEELPLDSLDVLDSHLKDRFTAALKSARLTLDSVEVKTTPRRIAIGVKNLSAKQSDHVLEFSGPSAEQAYSADGAPSPALEGFLKSKGAKLSDVQIKETPRGRFISVQKKETGKPAAQVIAQILKDTLSALPFPKMMRWEPSGFRFPRPIRWLVFLLDKRLVPCQIADVKSAATSYGHRFLAPGTFKILSADWAVYEKNLIKRHVILDLASRQSKIREQLASQYGQKNPDEELLHTVSQLVEEPFFLTGGFKSDYLKLPEAVLATCMKKNQKIFACRDAQGHVKNQFVAILNGRRGNLARIRSDFENVLESRLKDAQYFYQEDTKASLESKVEALSQIIYLGKLGTLKDKTQRIEKLSRVFAGKSGYPDLEKDLARAAHLSKADLMTRLVFEMPELQGVVGGEYAARSGEKSEVAAAIATQYLPKNLTEDFKNLKKSIGLLGAMLGVVDRFDHLVGAFGLGLDPTGSQDPFALRRSAGVLVKLIRSHKLSFSFRELLESATQGYGSALKIPPQEISKKLTVFLQDRVIFELGVSAGTRSYEILQAVLKAGSDDWAHVFARFEALVQLEQKDPDVFYKAAKVMERPANILKGFKGNVGTVDSSKLVEESEKQLFEILKSKGGLVLAAGKEQNYEKSTRILAENFSEILHVFFSKVLVNAEDAEICRNRHALMKQVFDLYGSSVADLSVLSR